MSYLSIFGYQILKPSFKGQTLLPHTILLRTFKASDLNNDKINIGKPPISL